jgi:hypothetical protein
MNACSPSTAKTIVAHADQARADRKEVVAQAWEAYLSDLLERDAGVQPSWPDFDPAALLRLDSQTRGRAWDTDSPNDWGTGDLGEVR